MTENEPTILGSGSGEFVKARDLVGEEFTVTAIRQGQSNYGPSYYLDIVHGGQPKVIGALATSAIGAQCARFGPKVTTEGTIWTIVQKQSKKFPDKPVYLLAFFEPPESEPAPESA